MKKSRSCMRTGRLMLVPFCVGVFSILSSASVHAEGQASSAQKETKSGYDVAVYYWPNFHVDPRNEAKLGKNWTEWELVKQAVPRFPGHEQPKIPLWGYSDESNPHEMARAIDAMADHGITAVIFDWYYYNDGPFLEDALDKGFLQAPNRAKVKFALMWANHDYVDIFPASPGKAKTLWYPGAITRQAFDAATDGIIKNYFSQPNYWKIKGAPYFSVYEMQSLVRALGGIEQTRDALESFRARTKAAGFPDLHLNGVDWGVNRVKLMDVDAATEAGLLNMTTSKDKPVLNDLEKVIGLLGINSVTSYTWTHYIRLKPQTNYPDWAGEGEKYWATAQKRYPVPFFPHISMGWDSSPRTDPAKRWAPTGGYPYTGIVVGNTPEEFKQALLKAKAYMDEEPRAERILTINSWNEWTEGSYLEPEKKYGLRYLDAIKDVFGGNRADAK